jgi:23S rRNA (guanine1835-N2)-methyltransferase
MASPTETEFVVPQGRFLLRRFPRHEGELLRAWDAADDYLLRQLHEDAVVAAGVIWIVNDGSGALTTALAATHQVYMSSDSWLAHEATRANLKDNDLANTGVTLLTSDMAPPVDVDAVLIKIPKSLALLEDQLHHLRQHIGPGVRILGAGMAKEIHTSTLQLFERIVGPTTTSLARRKARLVHCQMDTALDPGTNPYPTHYDLEGTDWTLSSRASVFCGERLDIGTRHLLAHIRVWDEAGDIIDLGCGNGVVGLVAAQRNPHSRLCFVDESYMAVASAQDNWQALFGDTRSAAFETADCLGSLAEGSADIILCNPPFHQHHAVGDATAWRMFTESRRVLRSGGELFVVGNRHLAYHAKLQRLFGHCEVLGSDRKFVVLRVRCR